MTKITSRQIIERLGITEQQFVMARYSGRIPSPDENGEWYLEDIDYILKRWNDQLTTKRNLDKYNGKNIVSGNLEFPKHTR